jgi:hypothetical protein
MRAFQSGPHPRLAERSEIVEGDPRREEAQRHAGSPLSIELADHADAPRKWSAEHTNSHAFFEHGEGHLRLLRTLMRPSLTPFPGVSRFSASQADDRPTETVMRTCKHQTYMIRGRIARALPPWTTMSCGRLEHRDLPGCERAWIFFSGVGLPPLVPERRFGYGDELER